MKLLYGIICGDCLEEMRKIPNNSVHLAITSPPYNVGVNYDKHNDKLAYKEYLDWMEKVWRETKRVLVPGGRFALNIAPTSIKNFRPIHHDFATQLRKIGMIFRTEILWYKQTMRRRTAWGSWKSPSNPHIVPSWEYVLVFSKDDWKLKGNPKDADISRDEFMRFSDGFWYIPPETNRRGHPAPFPENLIYRLIKFYTYKGNVVLDMFGGTGTVAAVAYKTGRQFIHLDISEEYCNIAKKRIEAATMQQDFNLAVPKKLYEIESQVREEPSLIQEARMPYKIYKSIKKKKSREKSTNRQGLSEKKGINPSTLISGITAEEALANLKETVKEYCPKVKFERLAKKELMLLLQSYAICVSKYHPERDHQERGALLENAEMLRKYGLTDEEYKSLDFC